MALRCLAPCWLLAAASLLTCGPVSAQDKADPPAPLLPRLFPQPTGRNGYEELVMAGDLAVSVEAKVDLALPGLTLTRRREALSAPESRQALALLHRGLGKPMSSPRDSVTFDSALPELARMRSLGRLLSADIRVCFADGRTRDAIASLQDGLNLSIALHGETLIGSLVAKAIETGVIDTFARYLDQLSASDCDRLLALAREWEKLPDPTIAALQAELRGQISSLEALRRDPTRTAVLLKAFFGDEQAQGMLASPEAARILQDPGLFARAIDDVEAALRGYFASALTELGRPPWQRRMPAPRPDGTVAGDLLEVLVPVLTPVASRFTEARARVLMLGVHAGIRRFRWEHDRLPGSMAELRPGAIAIDPCTGTPFTYRVTSPTGYELSSGGMPPAGGGARTPIIVPTPPKADAPGG